MNPLLRSCFWLVCFIKATERELEHTDSGITLKCQTYIVSAFSSSSHLAPSSHLVPQALCCQGFQAPKLLPGRAEVLATLMGMPESEEPCSYGLCYRPSEEAMYLRECCWPGQLAGCQGTSSDGLNLIYQKVWLGYQPCRHTTPVLAESHSWLDMSNINNSVDQRTDP